MNSDARWFKYYGDVPHTIEYPDISLYDIVFEAAQKHPLNIAYDFMGKSVNYKDFIDEIDTCAEALSVHGVSAGDTVTVCLPNVPQAVVMFYAINKLGAIASMIHPLSAENEILFYVNEVKSKIAITLSRFYDKFEAIKGKTQIEKLIVCKIEEVLPALKGFMYKFVGGEPKVSTAPGIISWPDFIASSKKFAVDIMPYGKGKDEAEVLQEHQRVYFCQISILMLLHSRPLQRQAALRRATLCFQ